MLDGFHSKIMIRKIIIWNLVKESKLCSALHLFKMRKTSQECYQKIYHKGVIKLTFISTMKVTRKKFLHFPEINKRKVNTPKCSCFERLSSLVHEVKDGFKLEMVLSCNVNKAHFHSSNKPVILN